MQLFLGMCAFNQKSLRLKNEAAAEQDFARRVSGDPPTMHCIGCRCLNSASADLQ